MVTKAMHGRTIMWDPISIFACMWLLGVDLPSARLNVQDVIQANQSREIHETVVLRKGV